MDKSKIKEFFSRAATTYDLNALPQRKWGEHLLSYISADRDNYTKILDIGMGTGSLTLKLARTFPDAQVFGCDIAPGMVEYARRKAKVVGLTSIEFEEADFECLPYHENCFDLVFSNLAFQWAPDIKLALKEAIRVLNPGGRFYFTTLGTGSLQELQHILVETELCSVRNIHSDRLDKISNGVKIESRYSFPDKDFLSLLMRSLTLQEFNIDTEEEKIVFKDFLSFLRWLKAIGANNGLELKLDGLAKGKYILRLQKLYPGVFSVTFEILFVSGLCCK